MSLFDSVIGGLLGNNPNAGGLQSVLGSILSGSQSNTGQPGLAGLVNNFQRAGLGNVVGSWIGSGPNQQVNPQQLQQAFGQGQVNQWAQQSGMQPNDLLSQLSQLLPHAVDRMTPNGEIQQLAGSATGSANPFDDAGTELPPRRA